MLSLTLKQLPAASLYSYGPISHYAVNVNVNTLKVKLENMTSCYKEARNPA